MNDFRYRKWHSNTVNFCESRVNLLLTYGQFLLSFKRHIYHRWLIIRKRSVSAAVINETVLGLWWGYQTLSVTSTHAMAGTQLARDQSVNSSPFKPLCLWWPKFFSTMDTVDGSVGSSTWEIPCSQKVGSEVSWVSLVNTGLSLWWGCWGLSFACFMWCLWNG